MPKMIQYNKVVGTSSIKPRVQRDVLDNISQNIPPPFLHGVGDIVGVNLSQSLQFLLILHEIPNHIGQELLIPKEFETLDSDFNKWRSREKVWEKLVEGRVTNYIMKLHGFNQEVTKSMVESWKDDRVKVNGVFFFIMEEVIASITEIPIEGFKFFRDNKLLANVVRDFVESEKELKEL